MFSYGCCWPYAAQLCRWIKVICDIVRLIQRFFSWSDVLKKSTPEAAVIEMITEAKNLMCLETKRLVSINCNAIKWFRLDGGGEYFARSLQLWLKERGSAYEVTTAHTSKCNRITGRLNHTLLNISWTLMLRTKTFCEDMWANAVRTACFLQNRPISTRSKIECTSMK